MSIFRASDYHQKKIKLATQDKTKNNLIHCPLRCTQRRTRKNRLSERKTFDPKTGRCKNCGFIKINNISPLYFKASQIQ